MPQLETELAKIGESALALVAATGRRIGRHQAVIGTVHSVFRRVVNFTAPDGHLFALTAPGVPCAPNSLVAAAALAGERGWLGLGLVPGEPLDLITTGAGRAEVYRALIHRLPTLALPSAGFRGNADRVRRAQEAAVGRTAPSPLLTGDPFADLARPHLARLVEKVQAAASGAPLDDRGLARAARGLIGLGPGLTPAGDDLLAGFMMAFAVVCARQGCPELALEGVNPAIMREAPGATGELSMEFLRYAALGQGNELLDDLLEAIIAGDERRSVTAAAQLAQVGATSGVDQLLGLGLGVRLGLEARGNRSPA